MQEHTNKQADDFSSFDPWSMCFEEEMDLHSPLLNFETEVFVVHVVLQSKRGRIYVGFSS